MTVPEFFTQVGDMLIGREHGPLHLRFVFQPLVAVVIATRVGIRDAREGLPDFLFLAAIMDKARRAELLREVWRNVGKVLIVAFTLDVIYELIVWRRVYPIQAVLVAVVLAVVPYLLIRGPATRIARRFLKTNADSDERES